MNEKRKIRKARENGELLPSKKPGGSLGHKGVSHKHNPTSIVKHTMKNTKCSCGPWNTRVQERVTLSITYQQLQQRSDI